MVESTLTACSLSGLQHLSSGKVREMFAVGESLLIVTTDRLSAFDVVMANGIPSKGQVLNRLSEFWFRTLDVPHHMITCEVEHMPAEVQRHADVLRGRAMLTNRARPFPVECVARGYLIGSGWSDYQRTGAVCGIPLPKGLRLASKLPEPIFTPATKAVTGHDENIGFETMASTVGQSTAERLRDLTLAIYKRGAAHAETKGLILADTKLEFGLVDGQITLIDEALTPDSSRYWLASEYREGISPPSFDKQFVRDYLDSIHFNKQPPGPVLPPDIVGKTRDKYLEAFRLLTGRALAA